MRGKVKIPVVVGYKNRITPAYAGKSPAVVGVCDNKQDHPRLCGEKTTGKVKFKTDLGSPPPMRGKACMIPAFLNHHQDHPRLCGEKRKSPKLRHFHRGSPPPMRGKAAGKWCQCGKNRITPAYAGKRHPLFHSPEVEQDHPRLCGEKGNFFMNWIQNFRITPAYAGKSLKRRMRQFGCQDHPRLCGEKLETRHDFTEKLGSPPPMRGKV